MQKLDVDKLGALRLGQHQPDEQNRLESVIEGKVVDQKAAEGFKHREEAENHPVGQPGCEVLVGGSVILLGAAMGARMAELICVPLLVVFQVGRIDRDKGEVRGKPNS